MKNHSEELERLVIGNALLNKRLTQTEKRISTADFAVSTNQWIWSAILELDEEGEIIETFDVYQRTSDAHEEDFVLRLADVSAFMSGASGTTRSKDVEKLKEFATLRFLERSFKRLTSAIEEGGKLAEVIEDAENTISRVKTENDNRNGNSKSLVEVFEQEVFPRLDQFVSGELVKIPTGFGPLDDATNGGASIGDLVVWGARPKQGKSFKLLQIANHTSSLSFATNVISREMLNHENGFRFLAQTSAKYSLNVFRPNMHPQLAENLKQQAGQFFDRKLRFDDRTNNMRDLRKETKRLVESENLKVLVVDYAQLMRSTGKNENRANELEDIIYGLKDLAMENQIVVHAAAQFNREAGKTDRPRMHHFDGSSAFEKAANLILIWQLEEEKNVIDDHRAGTAWIEAGRNVGTDEFKLKFFGKEARFAYVEAA